MKNFLTFAAGIVALVPVAFMFAVDDFFIVLFCGIYTIALYIASLTRFRAFWQRFANVVEQWQDHFISCAHT